MNKRMTRAAEARAKAYIKDNGVPKGTTIHINHDECGDTRRRLYATVKDDGSVVMWCHNCQEWGGARLHARGPRVREAAVVTKDPIIREEDMILDDVNPRFEYLTDYGILPDTIVTYGIQWERTLGRLHYPVRDSMGTMIGGQLRHIPSEGHNDIKFLSWRKDQSVSMQQLIYPFASKNNTLVIVEDYLSACKVKQARPDVDALPLFTTSLQADTAVKIREGEYKNILVWLDNDGPLIQQASDKIKQLLTLMGCGNVVQITKTVEPKKKDDEFIKELIKAIEVLNDAGSRATENPEVPF